MTTKINDEKNKKLGSFLKEAQINSREDYWNDPDLFKGSDELLALLKSGKIKMDEDNIASSKD